MMATKYVGPCLGMKFMPNGKWQTDGPPLSKVFVEKAHDRRGSDWRSKGARVPWTFVATGNLSFISSMDPSAMKEYR